MKILYFWITYVVASYIISIPMLRVYVAKGLVQSSGDAFWSWAFSPVTVPAVILASSCQWLDSMETPQFVRRFSRAVLGVKDQPDDTIPERAAS